MRAYAVGTMRRPLVVRLRGRTDLLGVRFRPGGAVPFLAPPAHELTDRTVPLADLWRGADDLAERLAVMDGPSRIRSLASLLLRRSVDGPAPDPRVLRAARRIEATDGRVSVRELHGELEMSRRQLERLFLGAVGVPPKVACRVARFRGALRRLDRDPAASWSRLAHASGYADQPHLAREFRALAGVTPGEYRAERGRVASVQDAAAATA